MPLEDIALRIDTLHRDLDKVDELVENIVRDCGVRATISAATFRMGGRTEIDETPDGPRTLLVIGEEVPSECIIHIAEVPASVINNIRQELAATFIVLDDDFRMGPEDPPDIDEDDDESEDTHWLADELSDWR